MLVSAHQVNLLPGTSVWNKLLASDAVIFLDEVQYTKGGFTNRNRMPDGSWLTVPIERVTDGMAINRVRIHDGIDWRRKACCTLRQHYGAVDLIEKICEEVMLPYKLLVGLNTAIIRHMFDEEAYPPRYCFQSHLDGGRAVVAVSENRDELAPISVRLAMMVSELGGDVYLSGPSGRRYLNEEPFHELGIRVDYWQHEGPNPCALSRLKAVA